MLELRLTADAKRIASMRDAVARECARMDAGAVHAEVVALVVEQLVGPTPARGARRAEVLVVVTVQSDATMLMVRDPRPVESEIGPERLSLLETYASGWSTISGRDGRTIWAELARAVTSEPVAPEPRAPEPVTPAPVASAPAVSQSVADDYRAPRERNGIDERAAGPGGWRLVPAGIRR